MISEEKKKCTVKDCENVYCAMGLCRPHYTIEYGKKLKEWKAKMDKIEFKTHR